MKQETLTPLKRCSLDPSKHEAPPALVLEELLVNLDADSFEEARPPQYSIFNNDKPPKTGVKWIDEQENKEWQLHKKLQ